MRLYRFPIIAFSSALCIINRLYYLNFVIMTVWKNRLVGFKVFGTQHKHQQQGKHFIFIKVIMDDVLLI